MPTQQQPGQPTDLLIKANELVHLNNIIEQIPTKFGLPLVQFFSQVSALRNQEAQVASTQNTKDDKPTGKGKKDKEGADQK
jgi:hypothetical protein